VARRKYLITPYKKKNSNISVGVFTHRFVFVLNWYMPGGRTNAKNLGEPAGEPPWVLLDEVLFYRFGLLKSFIC